MDCTETGMDSRIRYKNGYEIYLPCLIKGTEKLDILVRNRVRSGFGEPSYTPRPKIHIYVHNV